MSTIERGFTTTNSEPNTAVRLPNGAAMAAFLAAGFGAFAMGLLVLLNEMGIFAAPTLYEPAGGVSGRTTFAVIAWLAAWGLLHVAWKEREVGSGHVWLVTAILAIMGILGTFPPFWGLLS